MATNISTVGRFQVLVEAGNFSIVPPGHSHAIKGAGVLLVLNPPGEAVTTQIGFRDAAPVPATTRYPYNQKRLLPAR
jgi:hypothetical protein